MATELLEKVRSGAKQGSIQLKDVEEILSNRDFTSGEGLLVTDSNGVSTQQNTFMSLQLISSELQITF